MFDVIVIGGGTAGLRTSLAIASKGKRIALIEPGILGGTCLNNGCIPTKAMLHASHLYKQSAELDKFGITNSPKLNFKKLMAYVNFFPQFGQAHIKKSVKKYKNLTLVKGKAQFNGKNSIKVGNNELQAKKFIICCLVLFGSVAKSNSLP